MLKRGLAFAVALPISIAVMFAAYLATAAILNALAFDLMRTLLTFLQRFADPVYCLTRVIVGLMFACHGGQKILGFPAGGHLASSGLGWWAGWIELLCGFLVAFGLLTRIAAFIASGEMAVAYFLVGFPGAEGIHGTVALARVLPLLNGTEAAVLYCWFFFFFAFYGSGRWSVDAIVKRRWQPATNVKRCRT